MTGTSSWAPIAPVNFLKNITSLANNNGCTWVTFTFAPADKNGTWQIDDFYVDPIKSQ